MKKVYCNNCIWFNWYVYKFKNGEIYISGFIDLKYEIICHAKEYKNNNCKYYKKKWWKFWV